jgi:hypothetical protein
MADTKISALTAATTPLAGTEVVPLVQSGTTKKATVDSLTYGRTFATVAGAIASTPTATAVTAFASESEAVYIVNAWITGSAFPTGFNPVAIVRTSGGVADVVTLAVASNLTITVSGLNVQLTQTTGVNQVMQYSALRMS